MMPNEHVRAIRQRMAFTTPAEWATIMGDLFADFLMRPRGAERRGDLSESVELALQDARTHLREAREEILGGGR